MRGRPSRTKSSMFWETLQHGGLPFDELPAAFRTYGPAA